MYACVQRTGAQVASCLIAAGADPGMEDYSGASALVYAINAQHRPTLKVGAFGGDGWRWRIKVVQNKDACCMHVNVTEILNYSGSIQK